MTQPPCEQLLAALLGSIDPLDQGAVDEHLRGCDRCRAALDRELAAPALALEPLAPRPSLRDDILAGLDGVPPYPGFVRRFARMFRIPEAKARAVLLESADPSLWMPIAPGVRLMPFEPGAVPPGNSAAMVVVEAGGSFPHHQHTGDELTLVLSGLLRDLPSGKVASPGDIVLCADATEHSFDVPGAEACVSAVLLGGAPVFVG